MDGVVTDVLTPRRALKEKEGSLQGERVYSFIAVTGAYRHGIVFLDCSFALHVKTRSLVKACPLITPSHNQLTGGVSIFQDLTASNNNGTSWIPDPFRQNARTALSSSRSPSHTLPEGRTPVDHERLILPYLTTSYPSHFFPI